MELSDWPLLLTLMEVIRSLRICGSTLNMQGQHPLPIFIIICTQYACSLIKNIMADFNEELAPPTGSAAGVDEYLEQTYALGDVVQMDRE